MGSMKTSKGATTKSSTALAKVRTGPSSSNILVDYAFNVRHYGTSSVLQKVTNLLRLHTVDTRLILGLVFSPAFKIQNRHCVTVN